MSNHGGGGGGGSDEKDQALRLVQVYDDDLCKLNEEYGQMLNNYNENEQVNLTTATTTTTTTSDIECCVRRLRLNVSLTSQLVLSLITIIIISGCFWWIYNILVNNFHRDF